MPLDDAKRAADYVRDVAVREAEILRLRAELRTIIHVAESQTWSAPDLVPDICKKALERSLMLFPELEVE